MSKNYSLVEIKSLFENIEDQIFSMLLDPSEGSNSHYFENFTNISLRTLKYLNHYLNILQPDQKIGSILSSIYQNFNRSFNEYRSRNIYVESYLSTPLAITEDEQKQQDEIYHFMNTRNNNIPLRCLGTPQFQRQRMELALFVQQMDKKKVTLKEPKRSFQIPPSQLPGFKVIRKTTYDPYLRDSVPEQDPLNTIASEVPIQTDKMKQNQEVQTQTDFMFHELQTQTEKEEDEAKSLAESNFKSEITMTLEQNLQDSVKKKSKVSIKSKKLGKGVDSKVTQKKKKAHIASNVKLEQQKKQLKQQKTLTTQDLNSNQKKQCSIKSICVGQINKLSSQQVNVLYSNHELKIIQKEVQPSQAELVENQIEQTVYTNDSQQIKIRLSTADVRKKKGMEVINQTQEEHYHNQRKSNPSAFLEETLFQQVMIKVSKDENQIKKVDSKLQEIQTNLNNLRQSKLIPIASVQIDETAASTVNYQQIQDVKEVKEMKEKKSSARSHQRRVTNLDRRQSFVKGPQSVLFGSSISQQKSQKEVIQPKYVISEWRENQKLELSKVKELLQISAQLQNKQNQALPQKVHLAQIPRQQQHLQDNHLAPISQNNTFQRFSKLNVRKSMLQNVSKRLKNKFVHSSDYLDKYPNNSVDISQNNQSKLPIGNTQPTKKRSSLRKESMFIINNRGKVAVHSSLHEQRQSLHQQSHGQQPTISVNKPKISVKQPPNISKAKVKLINLSKLNDQQPLKKSSGQDIKRSSPQKMHALQQFKQNDVLTYSSANQFLQNSGLKSQKVEKTQQVQKGYRQSRHHNNSILRNKKIAESCHISNSHSQYNLIAKQLRQRHKREMIVQYLDLIQTSHRRFCGDNCVHIENLYKRMNLDGTRTDEDIIEQLLRLIKKGK